MSAFGPKRTRTSALHMFAPNQNGHSRRRLKLFPPLRPFHGPRFFCACLQRHKRGVFITELGQYFRLSLEPSNEPGGRWTRRGIGAVDRVQPKEAVFVFGNVEPNEPTSIDVLVHKRLGHIAPTDTFPQ